MVEITIGHDDEDEDEMPVAPAQDRFTIACMTIAGVAAIAAVTWVLYMICFVAPDNNGNRVVQKNKDRLEACDDPEAPPAEVAMCVLALEAK